MPVVVTCRCNKRFRVPDEHVGKALKCPNCGAVLTVSPSPAQGAALADLRRLESGAAAASTFVCPLCGRSASFDRAVRRNEQLVCAGCARKSAAVRPRPLAAQQAAPPGSGRKPGTGLVVAGGVTLVLALTVAVILVIPPLLRLSAGLTAGGGSSNPTGTPGSTGGTAAGDPAPGPNALSRIVNTRTFSARDLEGPWSGTGSSGDLVDVTITANGRMSYKFANVSSSEGAGPATIDAANRRAVYGHRLGEFTAVLQADGTLQFDYFEARMLRGKENLVPPAPRRAILRRGAQTYLARAGDPGQIRAFLEMVPKGGRNWTSREPVPADFTHLPSPPPIDRLLAIRPLVDEVLALPGAGEPGSARIPLEWCVLPGKSLPTDGDLEVGIVCRDAQGKLLPLAHHRVPLFSLDRTLALRAFGALWKRQLTQTYIGTADAHVYLAHQTPVGGLRIISNVLTIKVTFVAE